MATTPSGPGSPQAPVDSGAGSNAGGPETTAADDAAARRRSRRLRKVLVNVLVVLTCLSALVTVVAVWSHRTLFNTDQWMEVVGPLAEDPAVTDTVATALTNQLFQVIDAEQYAKEALPDEAAFLAGPLSNAVQGFVRDGVEQLLQTEQFQQVWDKANRLTHETVVKLLRGEPVAGFIVIDGDVTLNLLPLLSRAMTRINDLAPRLFGDRPIPEITQETPIDQARSELSTALGRDLPDGFGVFVVFESDQLAAAQSLITLFDRLVWVLVGLTLVLLATALWLSRNRRRTVLVLGLGIALAMIVANAIIAAIEQQIVELIANETAREAVANAMRNLVDSLEVTTTTLTWIGLAAVLAAFLLGDGRVARGVRRSGMSAARRTRTAGAALIAPDGVASGVAPLPVVADNIGIFRAGGVAVTMLWLIVTDITWTKLVLILVVFAIYQLAVTILGRPSVPGDKTASTPS